MKNKILCLVLALTLTAGLLAGCAGGGQTSSIPSTQNPGSTPAGSNESNSRAPASGIPTVIRQDPDDLEWRDDVSPITFTIFHNNKTIETSGWQWGNDPITQHITARTGITLNYEFTPDAEDNRLTLMLAGGEKLPDFISYVQGDSQIMNEMIKGDYIYAINDLIDQYCPKMLGLMYKDEYTTARDKNGKVWLLPSQYVGKERLSSPYSVTNGLFGGVRTDIVRELGFEPGAIKTTDDLLALLKAFDKSKANYPDIKYPILIGPQAIGIGTFCGVFGEAASLGFYYDKPNDKIMNWFERPAGKEQLQFLNQLFRLGYIKPEVLTVARADYNGLLGAGTTFLLMKDNPWESASANASLQEVNPKAGMAPLGPVTKDADTQYKAFVYAGNPATERGIVVTKDCSNPERAIKFLEFLRTEEANLTIMSGIYEQDFVVATDDKGVKYPKTIGRALECGGDYDALSELGIYNYNRTWLAVDGIYDQLTDYGSRFIQGGEDIRAGRDAWLPCLDTTVASAATALVAFPAGSEMADLYSAIKATRETIISKIVLAKTDAEFESLYNDLVSKVKKAGSDRMFELMLPELHAQLAVYDPDGTYYH